MASLNKLAIRGIRSFDDKNISVIEFFTPVTVIVGHNGSGKTTIIECLKYASTGDQPPNTRGGAFIHDPKMANEKEVKAQVKLRFRAANGSRMLAIRNLSVSVKKTGAMTMKTLEGVLGLAESNDKSGKRGVISTKCAEMDIEIPQLLGVSKAVLENVIFCHQEDSYWPLAEPSTLKKKFDDIFEATKYTKALDAIRGLRKDKVAELKTEKAKLEGLSKEKATADSLRNTLSDLTAEIAQNTIELDQKREELRLQTDSNKKFYESSTKFREIYIKVDGLNSTKKHYQEELDALKENLHELAGTSEELEIRFRNFNDHISKKKEEKRSQQTTLADLEDDLKQRRVVHRDKVKEQGQLIAEAEAHKGHLGEREKLIRDLSVKYNMPGFDHSPLERDEVVQFISRLSELQSRQNAETDRVTIEANRANEEYNAKYRTLHSDREGFKGRKQDLQQRSIIMRNNIAKLRREVDNAESLTSDSEMVEADLEEKKQRFSRVRERIEAAHYDERINEKASKMQDLENRRSALTREFTLVNAQAETRARLESKREELKTKQTELKTALAVNGPRFQKLLGAEANPDTMERELERSIRDRNVEIPELSAAVTRENRNVQAIEATLASLRAQVKAKSDEVKALDDKIKSGWSRVSEGMDPGIKTHTDGLREAQNLIRETQGELGDARGSSGILTKFKKEGNQHKRCPLCQRDMNAQVLGVFEKAVNTELEKSSKESIRQMEEDLSEWEKALKSLQNLAQWATARDKMDKEEIPDLVAQIKDHEAQLPDANRAVEEAQERQNAAEKARSDMSSLIVNVKMISRIQQDVIRLKREVESAESDLLTNGSTKTSNDLQAEVDSVQAEIDTIKKEHSSLTTEKERQNTALQSLDRDVSALTTRLNEIKAELAQTAAKEGQIGEMQQEISDAKGTLEELDVKISEAGTAIDTLEQEYQITGRDLKAQIAEAQRSSQELNVSVDKLTAANRIIEKYVKAKRARALEDCNTKIDELDAEIAQLGQQLEGARKELSAIEKEINESNATVSNLRDNIRARKLVQDISKTQAEIDEYDLEEAAKAKRLFEEKYQLEQEKQTQLQSTVARLGGSIESLQQQLEVRKKEFNKYKDINRQYREQLVTVKLSDMANADLEKYAKALDSAIMKYHSLKMEEVNDTMRHLWNKTYQGTDIDGIKICSDDDKNTGTKRSYNYRVVMTKDQVEMDMRGRCSAGQKMLASIIIRLALADSFGQNCGILALDEPTNALDTENIDALASSLIDIINERKNHANFQLIIITHDESFLRKLGQSNVMEYYWRVSRDARQKSIIERHRFG